MGLKSFIKKKFPDIFYKLEDEMLYSTEDGILIAYKDLMLEITNPDTKSTFLFDLVEIDENTISIMREVDPLQAILEMDLVSLTELREKYEKLDEFEVCDFLTKQMNRLREND